MNLAYAGAGNIGTSHLPRRIWIDVEDLYEFARIGGFRPTGIQRVAFELCRALHAALPPDRVGFLRHAGAPDQGAGFAAIVWDDLQAKFAELAGAPVPPPPEPPPPAFRASSRARLKAALRGGLDHLPSDIRRPLSHGVRAQVRALRTLLQLATPRRAAPAAEPVAEPLIADIVDAGFADGVRPGDVLLVPGASFVHPDYPARVARAKQTHGLRLALLTYDIIPLSHPEFCPRPEADRFRTWLHDVLPLCEWVFAISRHGAAALTDTPPPRRCPSPGR